MGPGETQQSDFAGERRKHGARELSTSGGSDGCAVASDEGKHRARLYAVHRFGALPCARPLKGKRRSNAESKKDGDHHPSRDAQS